jgi:hypothetical protein
VVLLFLRVFFTISYEEVSNPMASPPPSLVRETLMSASESAFVRSVVDQLAIKFRITGSGDSTPTKALEFMQRLQAILCAKFPGGSGWHVALGSSFAYALKTHKKSAVVISIGAWKVVVWRSPAFELEDVDTVRIRAELKLSGPDEEARKVSRSKETRFLEKPDPASEEYDEIYPSVLLSLKSVLEDPESPKEAELLAKAVRRRLTAEFGPVWHVIVGSNFLCEVSSSGREGMCGVSCRQGEKGLRVFVFRHKNIETESGIMAVWRRVDLSAILSALPYFLILLFAFFYTVLKSHCWDGEGNLRAQEEGQLVGNFMRTK